MKKLGAKKIFGEALDNVYRVSLFNHESIAEFLEKAPLGARPIERFMGKELFYFQCPLTEEQRILLRAKPCHNFRKEIRRSRVLILTIKGKSTLSLEEGLDVVRRSPLDRETGLIELIAVNPKMLLPRRGGKGRGSDAMVHVYIQFKTVENACDMVNSVDAMKWQEWYVHSPQCDEHPVFYPDAGYDKDDYIWVSDQWGPVLGKKPVKVLKKKRREEDSPPTLMDCHFEIESSASGGTSITPELLPSVPMMAAPVGYQNITNMVMPALYDPSQFNATLALQQLAMVQALQQQAMQQPVYVTTGLPSYPAMSQPIILMNGPLSGVPVPGF